MSHHQGGEGEGEDGGRRGHFGLHSRHTGSGTGDFRELLLVTLTLPFSALLCVAAANAILLKAHIQSESRLKEGKISEIKR